MNEHEDEQKREEIREKIRERQKDFVGKADVPEDEKKDPDDINPGSHTPGPPQGVPR